MKFNYDAFDCIPNPGYLDFCQKKKKKTLKNNSAGSSLSTY